MKFLENPVLQRVSAFLSNCDVGKFVIGGMLEAYTCKSCNAFVRLSSYGMWVGAFFPQRCPVRMLRSSISEAEILLP